MDVINQPTVQTLFLPPKLHHNKQPLAGPWPWGALGTPQSWVPGQVGW